MARRVLNRSETYMAENEQERKVKRVLAMIQRSPGIQKQTLSRNTNWLHAKECNAILTGLVDDRWIFSDFVNHDTNTAESTSLQLSTEWTMQWCLSAWFADPMRVGTHRWSNKAKSASALRARRDAPEAV